jgi:hypothetical protein
MVLNLLSISGMRLAGVRLVAIWLALTAAALAQTTAPITSGERLVWFARSTVGPASLMGGAISAGFGTWTNQPHEYGPHWEGFGKRYGIRLTGVSTGNAMEAGLGAIWGEDPRYLRAGDRAAFKSRVGRVVKWAFVAPDRNGQLRPAYARYLATAGNNFLSNTWREDSESDTAHALERTALGFAARMAGNAFNEFWPDVSSRLFHRRR